MLAREFPTAIEHDYSEMDKHGYFVCQICGHRVKQIAGGTCPGVTVYHKWDDVPPRLATKTTIQKVHKKKLRKGQFPHGAKVKYDRKGNTNGHFYPLYAISQAVDKNPPTKAQTEALAKAQHMAERVPIPCSSCGGKIYDDWHNTIKVTRKQLTENADEYANRLCEQCEHDLFLKKCRDKAVQWAKDILANDNAVILDTETADMHGDIVEIAVINMQGDTVLNMRIKPDMPIAVGAYNVHGISEDMLQNSPTFTEAYERVLDAIEGKHLVVYNLSYDLPIIRRQCKENGLDKIELADSSCAMEAYAEWYGQWSDYHQSFRWQSLRGGDHSAIGDCLATLARIKEMANNEDTSPAH